ncbi:MAG TPA: amino acid adenylation domain-containing protein, partial [Thermoanaerobaculia bacterium]|nr:amino acid adenylation domain-containing protein [Thermoanaerobaculia bacterium]
QDLPFDRLVEELAPLRDPSRNPLADVFLILGNAPRPPRELAPGVRLGLAELEAGVAKVDLSLFLEEAEEGMTGIWEHSTDLFDTATVARMAGHLEVLLAGVVAAPEARIADLPLLSGEERAQLLLWNELTRHEHPDGDLLHELFLAQVERSPEAVAVIDGAQRLTYAELHDAVEALARELRALGVGPEVAVGVCLERSADLVVSLLATLAAGGFYVPLDPAYPAERLAFMLEDSGCAVVVTRTGLLPRLPEHEAHVIALDAPAKVLGARFIAPPSAPISGNLAYLIYTSGSTGRPKAVAIAHRSAALLVRWARREFSPEELAGVLASTSIAFDLSVFEIFVPLAAGGAVIVAENALALATLPARAEVTLVNTVPSAAAELLRMDALPPSAVTLNLAGEALPRALADRVYARPGIRRLYNLYGPSEDTTYSTWALIGRESRRAPSIGRPRDGTRAYVVDAGLSAQPVGVPGELLLGGDGLARGYLGRPELTAERFIPDPFGAEPGARLYRTGDLARYLVDGSLDYLGRLDHQVKVRGFRIELGEIEAALARHPAVEAAVVLAREDAALGLHLAAYVVPRPGQEPDRAVLQAALSERLPASMIPTAWAFLAELPLTPNGKVDRRALARLDAPVAPPLGGEAFAAPRSPVEEILAGVFAEILGVGRVSLRDDFFALGGHSLLATRVLSRVRQVLGVDLPVRSLFERPTVEGLAARVEELGREGAPQGPPLGPRPGPGPAPLSFAQERLWFLYLLDPGSTAYNLPLVVRLRGPLDAGALAAALREICRRHEALRTTFAEVAGEPVQIVSLLDPPPLPGVDLSGLPAPARAAEAERRTREEARRPFDLRRGPLARWSLLGLGSGEHVLLATFHHIVADGWSIGVLLRELSVLYRANLLGAPSPLPALPVQFGDYAAWQRRWLSGERLEAQLARWRELLAGAPTVLELPADRPRPPVQSYRGAVERRALGGALAAGVEGLSRRAGATPFMTILAAFYALLGRSTGREDLLVGTPVANRQRAEIEGLIGLFVNTLALRGDLAGDPSFAELLARTREAALAAFTHQDLPFEKLVLALAPERDLSRSPLVQVSFGLERAVAEVPELAPGVQFTVEEADLGTSKLDLTLVVEPGREGLEIVAEQSTDLFDATTVRRLLGHYRTLLEAAVARPEERLSSLPLLAEAERHQLLTEWNDTRSALSGRAAGTLAAFPWAPALVQGEESLSYGELEARVEALATRLRAHGVGPEVVVGIFLERSFDLVVALLAVLRAGGAYLPLDPAYPEERIAFLIQDSGAKHVITRETLKAAGSAGIPAGPLTSPSSSLAYVLYTSGSTGRPKGVGVPRSALAHHAEVMARRYGLGPGDRVLQFASVSFDVAAEEIFPTLLAGATLVLPPDPLGIAAERLSAFAERQGITVLNLPSPYWHEWVDVLAAGDRLPSGLRLVIAGSEAVSPEKLALWHRIAGGRVSWKNAYGLTETTVTSTLFSSGVPGPRVPVGAPIDNVRAHVLDVQGEPVAAGVPGELWIGGPGVARGYAGRPDLTAERFLPDRFVSGEPGARLYRTGDLARRRASGEIEILGRIDHQVKIRGFRIELGEVEAAVAAHPAVAAAVAVAREDRPGDRRLVAYAVLREELPPESLRDFVRERVPSHLVPTVFVVLDALPRTAQGKVDRAALPAPALSHGSGFVSPRTPLEALVAEIWAAVLGVERVGVDDSFWSLGGHSLLATRISSRLLEAFGVEMPLQALFEHPTLAGFAAAVGRRMLDGRDEEVQSFLAEIDGLSAEQMGDLLRAESVERI